MNTQDAKRVLETALICAQAPLPLRELLALFDEQVGPDTVRSLLDELAGDWQGRGCELVAKRQQEILSGTFRVDIDESIPKSQ